jgi:glycosyltransferase involved in cell wall biosynthesis
MLRAVAFVPHPPAGASGRYRVWKMAEPLAREGIALDVRPFLDGDGFRVLYEQGATLRKSAAMLAGARRRWRDVGPGGRWDVALVHRELWPLPSAGALTRLLQHHPRFVFDFDDAVFLPNVSEANRWFGWLKPRDQAERLAATAAAVSAGNAWLAAWAARVRGGDASSVTVVPTAVDAREWRPGAPSAGPPRLVWTGSHSTVGYLEAIRPAIARVAKRWPDLELHVMGARFADASFRVVTHEWSEGAEVELVRSAHVGLSPLADEEWALGKCGLKLLLYMSCGLAAVASPVGVHATIVEPGVNGLLARDADAFAEAIELLLVDADRRREIGARARATVEAHYSLEHVAPTLAALLTRAAEGAFA